MANWQEYTWLVVVGALLAFFMAYGIGANDVANAFATSVGSKTLTLFQATILAAIFEFSGALLLGRGVTDTVRKGIIDASFYENSPEILAFGNLCALGAAGIWLIVATYFELPVSTTHSIIGGLIGFSMVAYGAQSVIWHEMDYSKDFPIKGISSVVISWVFSPVASGIVAAAFFFSTRTLILRAENSYDRTFMFLPVLVLICIFINAFYVLDKGIAKQLKKDSGKEISTADSAAYAAAAAAGAFLVTIGISIWLKKRLDLMHAKGETDAEEAPVMDGMKSGGEEDKPTSFFSKLSGYVNSNDPHSAVDQDDKVKDIHDNAEVFNERTEGVFRYLQVLTSCCDSFAHGANDVANSIGPFAAIWAVYKKNDLAKKSEVPIWILVIGGAGIVIGLGTYGYTIIKAIGVKMTKITPSRGFSIELGSALVVVTGSYLGLPLSTTHCQVGATVAVGLIEGARGVGWSIVAKAAVGWVFTLVIVGLISAMFMALGIYSPNINASTSLATLEEQVNREYTAILDRMEGCAMTSGFPSAEDVRSIRGVLVGTTVKNFKFPDRVTDLIGYMSVLHAESADICLNANYTRITEDERTGELAQIYEPDDISLKEEVLARAEAEAESSS